jgi:hypothetical protein
LAALIVVPARAQLAGSWDVVPSPSAGPMTTGNQLLDVVSLSSHDAWAVGVKPKSAGSALTAPLALHWDGAAWAIVDMPAIVATKSTLNSVAAAGAADVWAVGNSLDTSCGLCDRTLIEHWNGSAWSVIPSPNPGLANLLDGVAAVAPDDVWAVGHRWLDWSVWVPLVLHWDGATWSSVDVPQLPNAKLVSVFALAADDIWAVGDAGTSGAIDALALHWDGHAWTQVPVPGEPGGWVLLRGVAGVASDDVWAVGCYQYLNLWGHVESKARSYHWDGETWTGEVVPLGGGGGGVARLMAVDALASDDVWAVGSGTDDVDLIYKYVTMHWDGAGWTSIDNPNAGVLNSISAASPADAWAVGLDIATLGTHTLHWTSGPWTILGSGLAGVAGVPQLAASGTLEPGSPGGITLDHAKPLAPAALFAALGSVPAPFKGGVLVAAPPVATLALGTDGVGGIELSFTWPPKVPSGTEIVLQAAVLDPAAVAGVALSAGVKGVTP